MSEFQPNTELDSQEGRINPDYERRRQELDESRRKLEYDEGILDQREAFGVYDNHGGADIPEGELTWGQYIENRPKEGVIRDERNGGFRDAESGQFASKEDYESGLERDDSGTVEVQEAVNYSDMSSSALVKEALLARKRGDTADEKEILDIVSERLTHEISNNLEDYKIKLEESNEKAEAMERRLEEEMGVFRARIDKLEAMAYPKSNNNESDPANNEPAPKPQELEPPVPEDPEQEGLAPEKIAIVETYTGDNSGKVIVEFVDNEGHIGYTSKEDFDLRTGVVSIGNETLSGTDSPESNGVGLTKEQLRMQAERRELYLKKIEETNPDRADFLRSIINKMEAIEAESGVLFKDITHFNDFNRFSQKDDDFGTGHSEGFDRGGKVRVEGDENAWTFIGIDSEGKAVLARNDEHNMPERAKFDVFAVKAEVDHDDGEESGEVEKDFKAKFGKWWGNNKKYFQTSYWSAKATVAMQNMGGEGDSENDSENESRRRERNASIAKGAAILGVVALGAYLMNKYGTDSIDASSLGDTGPDASLNVDPSSLGGGESIVDVSDNGVAEVISQSPDVYIDNPIYEVPSGSGGEALFQRMNLNPTDWYGVQEQLLTNFPSDFYRMDSGNVGLSHSGWLSEEARTFLENYKNGNI